MFVTILMSLMLAVLDGDGACCDWLHSPVPELVNHHHHIPRPHFVIIITNANTRQQQRRPLLPISSYKRSGFVLDIARDIRGINDVALKAKKSGVIVLGGGLVKHHTLNANLMRNGADYSVFINTVREEI